MDPNVAWGILCDLMDGPVGEDECWEALDLVDSLTCWAGRGGFLPNGIGMSRHAFIRLLTALREHFTRVSDGLILLPAR